MSGLEGASARQHVRMELGEAMRGQLALASLDRLAMAAFILGADGLVHHLNASAKKVLHRERCCTVRNGRFRLNDAALNMAFEEALRRATRERPAGSLLPLLSHTQQVYELTVSPLEADDGQAGVFATPPMQLVLVTIARPRGDAKLIAERVRRLYGLTHAEARVVSALVLGRTVDEIALAHGVRASTVRAQVRSIYNKIGVNRQADLVRLALSGAPLVTSSDQ